MAAIRDNPDEDARIAEIGRILGEIGDELSAKNDDLLKQQLEMIQNRTFFEMGYLGFITNIKILTRIVSVFLSAESLKRFLYLLGSLFQSSTARKSAEGDMPVPSNEESDSDVYKRYYQALESGREYVRHIRLMVVGMYGVGKTSLVSNILQGNTSDQRADLEKTDGIDLHVNECVIDAQNNWLRTDPTTEMMPDYTKRLAQAMTDTVEDFPACENGSARQLGDTGVEGPPEKTTATDVQGRLQAFKDEGEVILEDFCRQVLEAWQLVCGGRTGACHREDIQAKVTVWDFAGQYVYYSTHHFFMNNRSIYFLVVDVSKGLDEKVEDVQGISPPGGVHQDFTTLDALKFWLRSIHIYSRDEEGNFPKVILVGTHKDKLNCVPNTEEEKHQYMEAYFNKALECFIGTQILNHIHPVKFLVNNIDSEEDFGPLREEVLKLAKADSCWDETIPSLWIPLERSLEVMKFEGKEMISFEELLKADLQNEYPIQNPGEIQTFLQFHHKEGRILYFVNEHLKEHVVLSLQWIIDAFRCFITAPRFCHKDPRDLHMWKEYEDNAILHPELVEKILSQRRHLCFLDHKDEILMLMEHLDIIAKPNVSVLYQRVQRPATMEQTAGDGSDDRRMQDFFIVPCMLKSHPSKDVLQQQTGPRSPDSTTPVLSFVFKNKFLPPAVYHRLVAACVREWPIVTVDQKYLLYNGLAVFSVTTLTWLTVWMHEHLISVRLEDFANGGKSLQPRLCCEVRELLEEMLGGILDTYQQQSQPYDQYIRCDRVNSPAAGLLKVSSLLHSDGGLLCADHPRQHIHTVTPEQALHHWFNYSTQQVDGQLNRVPTDKELSRLSFKIGKEYKQLGIELNVPLVKMDQIQMDQPYNVKLQILEILHAWKVSNGEDATLLKLRVAMEEVGSDLDAFRVVFSVY